jgi:hypothetical protein
MDPETLTCTIANNYSRFSKAARNCENKTQRTAETYMHLGVYGSAIVQNL